MSNNVVKAGNASFIVSYDSLGFRKVSDFTFGDAPPGIRRTVSFYICNRSRRMTLKITAQNPNWLNPNLLADIKLENTFGATPLERYRSRKIDFSITTLKQLSLPTGQTIFKFEPVFTGTLV